LNIARRLIWWMPSEEAVRERALFIAQVMTLGTWDDVELVRCELGEDAFRETLQHPPPGIFDAHSWHYWHRRFGQDTIPPLPKRQLP
jgi:hypothetical protein